MPIHYSSRKHAWFSISSPLATQIPQAVGFGFGLKAEKSDKICVTYFGEGSTSEGDF